MMKKYADIKREAKVLRFVWKMAKGEHGKIITVFFINILSALIPAGIAYFVKLYMDFHSVNFTNLFNKEDLILFLTLFVSGIFLKTIAGLIMGYAMPNIKRNIEISCIKKFAALPHAYISDCIDNRIIMTLSIESGMILGLIPMVYRSFIRAPITIFGFVMVLIFVSPVLTCICLILISTVVVGVLLFRKAIKRLNKQTYDRIGDLHQYFSEWLSGYRIFVVSNATRFIEKQLIHVSKELAGLSKRMAKINAFQTITIEIITIAITIVFVLIAAKSQVTSDNVFNIGELLLFPTAILFIRGEILNIIYGYMQLAGTESAARRIIDIIEYPLSESSGNEVIAETIDSLAFNHVTFRYDEASGNIFNAASMTFEKGLLNTITGRSGVGKTTFINLCVHLRLPCVGAILYNSKDISVVSEKNLLDRIALVEQEPFIFEGTLAENLFFDREPDIPLALAMLDRFKLAYLAQNADEIQQLKVGARGRQLSTGEKQRIAIIRALVRNPEVIFLDEITSNIDASAAAIIIEVIVSLAAEKLVVCVSHDERLIDRSGRIFRIDNGKIYEGSKYCDN